MNRYEEDKDGRLVGCTVSGPDKKPIVNVSYVTDGDGKIKEERIFDRPDGRLIQRIVYRHDTGGRCLDTVFYDENSRPFSSARALPATYDERVLHMAKDNQPTPCGKVPNPSGR